MGRRPSGSRTHIRLRRSNIIANTIYTLIRRWKPVKGCEHLTSVQKDLTTVALQVIASVLRPSKCEHCKESHGARPEDTTNGRGERGVIRKGHAWGTEDLLAPACGWVPSARRLHA